MNKKEEDKQQQTAPVTVNAGASLGILALGAVGVKAWKKKLAEQKKEQEKKDHNE
jgi:hypothetical protein